MGELERKSREQSKSEAEALREAAEQGQERIREKREKLERSSPENDVDRKEVAREAHELARTSEKESSAAHDKERTAERKTPRTKKERDDSYKEIMRETRSHMSAPSRAFSKVIHNPAVEATSEAIGNTVARPNAILSGSVAAFVIGLGVYLVARHFGYPLSGTETIAVFFIGWLIGILFDFLKTMITGKR